MSDLHLTLYGWYRSSCATRLRIALAHKGLAYTPVFVDYAGHEHRSAAYAAINPSMTLPTLVAADHPGPPTPQDLHITQSVAALEFLEDAFPAVQPSLRPAAPADRARMRALVEIICGDTQPRTTSHTLEMLVAIVGELLPADLLAAPPSGLDKSASLGSSPSGLDKSASLGSSPSGLDKSASSGVPPSCGRQPQVATDLGPVAAAADKIRIQWAHDWHVRGLRAYDALVDAQAHTYSVGNDVSLADVCLVPAVWNAVEHWGVQLDSFPGVAAIYERLMALPAFQAAHWAKQPDCPEALRQV